MINILLIEDNPEILENTAELLELEGYKVDTAKNGREGLDLANRLTPDLIISDIMMPEVDGYEVLHELSANPKTSAIPFIFLTAKAEKSDKKLGMNLGADNYLIKPFQTNELLKAVADSLQKKKELEQQFKHDLDVLNEMIILNRAELLDWLSEDEY